MEQIICPSGHTGRNTVQYSRKSKYTVLESLLNEVL